MKDKASGFCLQHYQLALPQWRDKISILWNLGRHGCLQCFLREHCWSDKVHIYSEKATQFCEISTLLLTGTTQDKSKVEISQNFAAFSEYRNFTALGTLLPIDSGHRATHILWLCVQQQQFFLLTTLFQVSVISCTFYESLVRLSACNDPMQWTFFFLLLVSFPVSIFYSLHQSLHLLYKAFAQRIKEGVCILFFCHSHSNSHKDISNVYLLVLSKATG